ncbi:hypothetical protein DERF_010236 [Dermatophagoides farinae]|uniref:Uncharacterized protein n=1 Tax=Dermatophagoides farinae TaxID=6954 RepID=A0A922L1T8_DERFA|nr:hypothetical protein DERF_010236 [Dermatophagoides farinae]
MHKIIHIMWMTNITNRFRCNITECISSKAIVWCIEICTKWWWKYSIITMKTMTHMMNNIVN